MSYTSPARPAVGARGPGARGYQQPPTQPNQQEPATASQQQPPQPESGCSGYHRIAPNEVKRNKLQTNARKEMESLQRYKEARRPGPINLAPMKLGGYVSEYEARQQQQNSLRQSRYQQQLKREEYKRQQKAEEDAEIRKMKAMQREKANQLEEKRSQQEKQRKQMFAVDQYQKNTELLRRLDLGPTNGEYNLEQESGEYNFDQESSLWESEPTSWHQAHYAPVAAPSAWSRSHAYGQARKEEERQQVQQMKGEQQRKSELLECKQKQEETEKAKSLQRDHRRVNNAFLDRLESRNRGDSLPELFRSTESDFGYCSNKFAG